MTNKKTGESPPEDLDEDADDVTEIVPSPAAQSDNDKSDVTQILPMRSPADEPSRELPGKVIGRAGGGSKDDLVASARSSTLDDTSSGSDGEDEATKILFSSTISQTSTDDSQPDASTVDDQSIEEMEVYSKPVQEPSDGDGSVPSVATDKGTLNPEPEESSEKTVFLAPVSSSRKHDDFNPPVGWLVIVEGPGRGAVLSIHYGQNSIGRGDDQQIQLNYGDTQISRETHAFVIYDEMDRGFFLRDAGKKNLVRINKKPVMTPTQLKSHDQIQIGQTTCLFVPLCTQAFDWLGGEDDPATGPPSAPSQEGKSE